MEEVWEKWYIFAAFFKDKLNYFMKKIALLPLLVGLLMAVGCSSSDDESSDSKKETAAVYKQKIVGEWTLIGTMYFSESGFKKPEMQVDPTFKSDGTLVLSNDPTARHSYSINDNAQLELDHLDNDASLGIPTHEVLNMEFQDDYKILILGPDANGSKAKYQRK